MNATEMYIQITATIVTTIGILASIIISIKSLRLSEKSLKENDVNRRVAHKPFLYFDRGGFQMSIEYNNIGKRIGGFNPEYVEEQFKHLSNDIETIDLKPHYRQGDLVELPTYGWLRNYGPGTAVEVKVRWIPKLVWIGKEKFEINDDKLKEPQYGEVFNTMGLEPSFVFAHEASQLYKLPIFIVMDHEKKIKQVEGYFEIKYQDIFNETHTTLQEFYLFTHYEECKVHITFSDVIKS